MWKEFKEFAIQGNVIDMAVGIIIGGAFTPVVKSIVDDVLMPPLGLLLGNADFRNLYVLLKNGSDGAASYDSLQAAHDAGAVTLNYGQFVNTLVSFFIMALALFLVIKAVNKLRGKTAEPPAAAA